MAVKAVFIGILYFFRLALHSLGLLVTFIYRRRRATAIFHKTLLRHGLSPEVARDLTKAYPNPIGEIVNLVILRTRGERIRARHPR